MSSILAKLKKYRIIVLIVGLLVLSLSQYKFLMPVIYDVVKSDLFLVDTKDMGSDLPISTPLSNIAFTHCNNYIKSKSSPDETITFAEKPLKAWDMGNYQYLINAEINSGTAAAVSVSKQYTCRITYEKADNEEDALNIDNWSIIGVAINGVSL